MTPRVGRRTLLAFGALALVAFGCSEGNEGNAEGLEPLTPLGTGGDPAGGGESESQPTAAMIGDSITFMSTDPLRAALSGIGLDVRAIDAQVGRRITVGEGGQPYPGTDIVEFIANSDPPDVWVIALGTNDIGQYPDAEAFGTQVQTLLDLVPDDAPWSGSTPGTAPASTRPASSTTPCAPWSVSATTRWSSTGSATVTTKVSSPTIRSIRRLTAPSCSVRWSPTASRRWRRRSDRHPAGCSVRMWFGGSFTPHAHMTAPTPAPCW